MYTLSHIQFKTLLSTITVAGLFLISCDNVTDSSSTEGSNTGFDVNKNIVSVGPADNDGALLFAGRTEPSRRIGNPGDFYLNLSTGHLHGPKNNQQWENVIHDLSDPELERMEIESGSSAGMREYKDSENNGITVNRIHTGRKFPGDSLGSPGDYFLNTSGYKLFGPKTSNGWVDSVSLEELADEQAENEQNSSENRL